MQEGRFRDDLYCRLNVVPIELPPLRERREDIAELAQPLPRALRGASYGRAPQTLTDAALAALQRYRWPGNIRELENLMARIAVVCDVARSSTERPAARLRAGARPHRARRNDGQNLDAAMARVREELPAQGAEDRTAGTSRRTADQLGIGYSTLKAKLKAYGLVAGDDRDDEE